MTYRRFEDLPVWNAAVDLAIRIYDLSEQGRLGQFSGLRDQIERAVLSISNNIAEGFERGTMAELISFLYIARGSAGEVRSMVLILERIASGDDEDIVALKLQAADVCRQLAGWIGSLENSKIKGLRALTDQQKTERQASHRRHEFLDQLRRVQAGETSSIDDLSKDEDVV